MKNLIIFTLFCSLAFLLFTPCATSQTNWSVEGGLPSFTEYNSPPVPCWPMLPPYAFYPAPPPLIGCPTIAPFPFIVELGGTAFDNDGNSLSGGTAFPVMLHTDGYVLEMVDAATGAYIIGWPVGSGTILPGPINGLGYDSTGDVIWITDGYFCAGVGLSPSCTAPLPVIVPPFVLPTPGAGISRATGIDWDPCTSTLWYCDFAGNVVNCTTAGVLISSFIVMPFLSQGLMGLTVNTATVPTPITTPSVQVTDGFDFAEFNTLGVPTTPGAHYLMTNPYTIPSLGFAPYSGVGFTLRPMVYGKGCPPPGPGGVPPKIGWAGGYPFINNAGFTITMTGATPGSFAYLIVNTSLACSPLSLPGCPSSVWVAFPWLLTLPIGVVPAAGSLSVPAPMPISAFPCSSDVGVPIYCQFINVTFPGPTVVETSDALAFTIGDA